MILKNMLEEFQGNTDSSRHFVPPKFPSVLYVKRIYPEDVGRSQVFGWDMEGDRVGSEGGGGVMVKRRVMLTRAIELNAYFAK